MQPRDIERIVENHRGAPGGVLAVLQDIQERYSHLPEEALRIVAEKTGTSLTDLYGAATFYKAFTLRPRGKHLVSVCLGTACHVRQGAGVKEEFERLLGIGAGETTPDGEITLEAVNCLGACAIGPVAVVDGHVFPEVSRARVPGIIRAARAGLDRVDVATEDRLFPVEVACPRCNHSLMDRHHYVDGYPSIRVTAAWNETQGWLRLSCLFGSFAVEQERPVPKDAVVEFFCPHCHAGLSGIAACERCGAPMIPMIVRGGGMLHICSRRGCRGHALDLVGAAF